MVSIVLHRHERQKRKGCRVVGHNIKRHLTQTGRIKRCLSLRDVVVKGWIANPTTYPEDFKKEHVFLWGSERPDGHAIYVAYLFWVDGRVRVDWQWINHYWGKDDPAALTI